MARPFYEDNFRQSRILESMKAAQAAAERAVADAKARNAALLTTDPLRARLMAAYDRCDDANRAEVVRIAELACTAPGGII